MCSLEHWLICALENSRSSICLSPGHKRGRDSFPAICSGIWVEQITTAQASWYSQEKNIRNNTALALYPWRTVHCMKFVSCMKESTNIGYNSHRHSKHLYQLAHKKTPTTFLKYSAGSQDVLSVSKAWSAWFAQSVVNSSSALTCSF